MTVTNGRPERISDKERRRRRLVALHQKPNPELTAWLGYVLARWVRW